MSELTVFAILIVLSVLALSISIRNASIRISEAVENIRIYIEYEGEEDDQNNKEKKENEKC